MSTPDSSFCHGSRKYFHATIAVQLSSEEHDSCKDEPDTYKTEPCTEGQDCLVKNCVKYHSETDRRRSLKIYSYRAEMCKNGPKCPSGDNCIFAHSENEVFYHPQLFKKFLCQRFVLGECSLGKLCAFIHPQGFTSHTDNGNLNQACSTLSGTQDEKLKFNFQENQGVSLQTTPCLPFKIDLDQKIDIVAHVTPVSQPDPVIPVSQSDPASHLSHSGPANCVYGSDFASLVSWPDPGNLESQSGPVNEVPSFDHLSNVAQPESLMDQPGPSHCKTCPSNLSDQKKGCPNKRKQSFDLDSCLELQRNCKFKPTLSKGQTAANMKEKVKEKMKGTKQITGGKAAVPHEYPALKQTLQLLKNLGGSIGFGKRLDKPLQEAEKLKRCGRNPREIFLVKELCVLLDEAYKKIEMLVHDSETKGIGDVLLQLTSLRMNYSKFEDLAALVVPSSSSVLHLPKKTSGSKKMKVNCKNDGSFSAEIMLKKKGIQMEQKKTAEYKGKDPEKDCTEYKEKKKESCNVIVEDNEPVQEEKSCGKVSSVEDREEKSVLDDKETVKLTSHVKDKKKMTKKVHFDNKDIVHEYMASSQLEQLDKVHTQSVQLLNSQRVDDRNLELDLENSQASQHQENANCTSHCETNNLQQSSEEYCITQASTTDTEQHSKLVDDLHDDNVAIISHDIKSHLADKGSCSTPSSIAGSTDTCETKEIVTIILDNIRKSCTLNKEDLLTVLQNYPKLSEQNQQLVESYIEEIVSTSPSIADNLIKTLKEIWKNII